MRAHLAYLRYVLVHKWFVLIAGVRLRVPLWQLLIHDASKFGPAEWSAYVGTFYAPDGSKRYTPGMAFDLAWNHHQKANPHHWQHWVLVTDQDEPRYRGLPMPERYVREMVADWAGAGRAISGRWEVRQWYAKTRGTIILHDDTRAQVEQLLKEAP